MRTLGIVASVLILAGCDITTQSASSTPDSINSPFVTFQAAQDHPSAAAIAGGNIDNSTTNTDNNQAAIIDLSNLGSSETSNSESSETANSSTESTSSSSEPNNTSNTFTSGEPEASETPPITQSQANLLYQTLRNGRNNSESDIFWACSTGQEAFRMNFTGYDRDIGYDVTNANWGWASVHIKSVSDGYDFQSLGTRFWGVESADSITVVSSGDFSLISRFTSIRFDQAGNRFSALDSNGTAIACASVTETNEPYCTFDNPYGACVLSPIGVGDDAIEVVREFAPTTQLINGTSRHIWNNFRQCDSKSAPTSFRFYFTGDTGITYANIDDRREPSMGVGWRYEYDGSLFTDNSLNWEADALGTVSFTTNSNSNTERPLNTSSWSIYNIQTSEDTQSFTASDSRGYDFSCERLVENGAQFGTCFHSPDTCPEN